MHTYIYIDLAIALMPTCWLFTRSMNECLRIDIEHVRKWFCGIYSSLMVDVFAIKSHIYVDAVFIISTNHVSYCCFFLHWFTFCCCCYSFVFSIFIELQLVKSFIWKWRHINSNKSLKFSFSSLSTVLRTIDSKLFKKIKKCTATIRLKSKIYEEKPLIYECIV